QYRYEVSLDSTPCHFGRQRLWFRCPALGCGRRVALLYLGGRYFACRRCYRLAYRSQSQMPWERAIRASDRITARLDQDLEGNLTRPRRMRWATYERLAAQLKRYGELTLDGILTRFRGLRRLPPQFAA